MSYVDRNFQTKKEFLASVKAGEQHRIYNPSVMFDVSVKTGSDTVEGPHFPKPHRWYSSVTVVNGVVTSAK
jgi:hypothetical protein